MAVHKTLHLEESPHKCSVCNRSFNQRSNLKTHLLTHTDHKPYECGTCGKVFRRNCDLRRHALTHTIGGDIPSDSTDNLYKNANDTSENEDRNEPDDEIIDDDDIEVDSPVHSPIVNNQRQTPTPDAEQKAYAKKDEIVDVSKRMRSKRYLEALENSEPPQKIPRLDEKMTDEIAVTHCHHNGNERYTMRPSLNSELYPITLHVRRDLHYKNELAPLTMHMETPTRATITTSNSLNSVPFRKRSIEFSHEPAKDENAHQMPLYQSPLNLTNHVHVVNASEDNAGMYLFCFKFFLIDCLLHSND